jgi:hypothetical protein
MKVIIMEKCILFQTLKVEMLACAAGGTWRNRQFISSRKRRKVPNRKRVRCMPEDFSQDLA